MPAAPEEYNDTPDNRSGRSANPELSDTLATLTEIKEELNWVGEHSFAKRIVDQLDLVESAIREIGS